MRKAIILMLSRMIATYEISLVQSEMCCQHKGYTGFQKLSMKKKCKMSF